MRPCAQTGIPEPIILALGDIFERWDGKGFPDGKQGDDSALPARVAVDAARPVTQPQMATPLGRKLTRWPATTVDAASLLTR